MMEDSRQRAFQLSWMKTTRTLEEDLDLIPESSSLDHVTHHRIYAFVQTKGGTGKTTLARCLAYSKAFSNRFDSIALVELDPQGNLKDWYDERPESVNRQSKVKVFQLLTHDPDIIGGQMTRLEEKYESLILDLPGESTAKFATQFAAALSDIVLIPMRGSHADFQSFKKHVFPILENVLEHDTAKRGSFYIIPTFVHPNTNPETSQEYFTQRLPEWLHCLKYYLPLRSVYENYSWNSRTLYEYARSVKDSVRDHEQAVKAIHDVESIAREVLMIKPDTV